MQAHLLQTLWRCCDCKPARVRVSSHGSNWCTEHRLLERARTHKHAGSLPCALLQQPTDAFADATAAEQAQDALAMADVKACSRAEGWRRSLDRMGEHAQGCTPRSSKQAHGLKQLAFLLKPCMIVTVSALRKAVFS